MSYHQGLPTGLNASFRLRITRQQVHGPILSTCEFPSPYEFWDWQCRYYAIAGYGEHNSVLAEL